MASNHMSQPDFLQPLGEDNRDEHILIEFHRVLCNTNMSLLRNLFSAAAKDQEILKVLPNLPIYAKLPIDEKYHATVLYNYPEDLVFNLSKEKLSRETCRAFASQFMEPYNFKTLHLSRMSAIARNLLNAKFVKNLYVFADKFTIEMREYLSEMFADKGVDTQVHAMEGNFIECLCAKPEITTCFISNTSDLLAAEDYGHHLIDGKLFMIAQGYNNFVKDEKDEIQLAHLQKFHQWQQQHLANVAYMYPHCIERGV